MVTEVYGHIIGEDRRKNAELFEDAFYNNGDLNSDMHSITNKEDKKRSIDVPEGVDVEALMKVLANPEMTARLANLAKTIQK